MTLCKNAAVISYGSQADAILTTARRAPDAAPADQVLVALPKPDYRLEPTALGRPGDARTCSPGFMLSAEVIPIRCCACRIEKFTPRR